MSLQYYKIHVSKIVCGKTSALTQLPSLAP